MDAPTKTAQQEREEARTGRILSAARAQLVDRGYEAMRLADVAKEAGVAVGTVYLRFPGKVELLQAVMDETEARFEAALRDASLSVHPFPHRFRHIMAAMLQTAAEEEGLAALMALTNFAMTNDYQPGARLRVAIADQLSEGVSRGELRADLDLSMAAAMAHGLVEGAMSHAMNDPMVDPETLIETLADAATRWMAADDMAEHPQKP